MNGPLLPTKLNVPPTRPRLVPRPRLFKQLQAGLHYKLTIISAPAGFGKTTLVADWLAHYGESTGTAGLAASPVSALKVGWLTLDKGDNDPARFLSYLLAAVQSVKPGTGQELQTALRSPQLPPVEYLMMPLMQEIFEILDQPAASPKKELQPQFILVLDDYHLIDHQTVHTIVTFLIDHMPPQMHLVMTSRVDPPLPLSRWRARAQLLELRTAVLSLYLFSRYGHKRSVRP